MRAIYHPFDQHKKGDQVQITGDAAHHLNVVRVKQNEIILLLNGNGSKITGVVESVSKNNVTINISESENFLCEHELSLAIAMPKKDAFEDILKISVELGIKEIFPLVSEFSQYEYSPSERVQRVLESALIQSNNPFFPFIHPQQSIKQFLAGHQNTIVFFNSKKNDSHLSENAAEQKTILIGPEGGFSQEEIDQIMNFPKVLEIHLATPIMRAPTAVAASVGYLLNKI